MSSEPLGTTLAALLAEAQTDPPLAEAFHTYLLKPLRDQARPIFQRARARGEIEDGVDLEAAIDLLQGPLFLRLMHTNAPLNESFADTIVDMACHGLLRGRPAASPGL